MSEPRMVPRVVIDESGRVIAVAHVAPDISEAGMAALAELVAAARRRMDAAAARRRERVERWRRETGDTR